MKKHKVIIVTRFYKTITVDADNYDQAQEAAWNWIEENDALHNASVETDLYDIEEDEE